MFDIVVSKNVLFLYFVFGGFGGLLSLQAGRLPSHVLPSPVITLPLHRYSDLHICYNYYYYFFFLFFLNSLCLLL